MIRAIVTDIEGTTSSIDFVHEVLFPYAAEHLPEFVRAHRQEPEVQKILAQAAELGDLDSGDTEAIIALLLQWIREDRKATPLKALQGLIWQAGYENGDYRAHVYPDAAEVLRSWHAQGLPLYVYSSGSVHAQKLFFRHSEAGDLLPLFSGHFDTTTGAKRDPQAYRAIAADLQMPAEDILFLSDILEELDAARSAGMHTCWLLREGKPDTRSDHPAAHTFHDISLPG